jgi:hypothetical protein
METKSSGPDQMHPKFLKETAKNIAEPLTKIFQKSIETRKIPNTWKLANGLSLTNFSIDLHIMDVKLIGR